MANNSWVKGIGFWDYFQNLLQVIGQVFGVLFYENSFGLAGLIIEVATLLFLMKYEKEKAKLELLQLILISLLIIIPVLILQRVTIYQRVFGYLWVYQSIFFAMLLERIFIFFNKIKFFIALPILLSFVAFNVYNIHQVIFPEKNDWYSSADAMAWFLFKENAQNIYFSSYELSLCARFQYETNGKNILCTSAGNPPLIKNQYLVLEKPLKSIPGNSFSLIYTDQILNIYKGK